MPHPPALQRRLGTVDAVSIGLASMIGAGVFAVFAPAAALAGGGLLIALALAGAVSFANATSSAQLAAQYPSSGGTYLYGRERLGPRWGYLAGWSFVVGKTASCAAMAITFAAYAVPGAWQRPAAAAAVIVLGVVGGLGVTRTAAVARVVVALVLAVLVLVVVVGLGGGAGIGWSALGLGVGDTPGGLLGVLGAAGLLFFAFAGYARIATMGEEVREPRRTIPRAILIALTSAFVVYLAVALALLSALGSEDLARSTAPLADLAVAVGSGWLRPVVQVGAALASLGALLALLAGVSRTALAMSRGGDLPRGLSRVSDRGVPYVAELAVTVVVVILVLSVDLRGAIGFSSFGVLLYYLIANAAARTQERTDRLYPKWLQVLGGVGCIILMATLPAPSILGGVIVVAVGLATRPLLRRFFA